MDLLENILSDGFIDIIQTLVFTGIVVVAIVIGLITLLHIGRERRVKSHHRDLLLNPLPTSVQFLDADNGVGWEYAFFSTGMIPHYEHDYILSHREELSENKSVHRFKINGFDKIQATNIEHRIDLLKEFIGADKIKLENITATEFRLICKFGVDDFLNSVIPWKTEMRDLVKRSSSVVAVPLGKTEDGREGYLNLYDTHTLIVGRTGSGKGSVLGCIYGALSGRDDVQLAGVDFKGGVEFNRVSNAFTDVITEHSDFTELIDEVYSVMNHRYRVLSSRGMRSIPAQRACPMLAILIDEAADLNDIKKEFPDTMRKFDKILAKGRAAGISVIAATQRPQLKDFPWAKKFPQRVCLAVGSAYEQASILDNSYARRVFDMTQLPSSVKGMCMVRTEEGKLKVLKAYYPSDEETADLPVSLHKPLLEKRGV